ncbi:DEKNAAC104412 [Brettanomyces naardenensis]|uniref:DEKNAAC104412 n=1 Tax=Brettanomyces naardenensis TaxID=13370 RepID=A0A448YQU3_BRENA|nr:DEKNAAC104412 [Brettanomyces naardenensis]
MSNSFKEKSEAREAIREGVFTTESAASSESDFLLPQYEAVTGEQPQGLEVQSYEEDIIDVKSYAKNLFKDPGHRSLAYVRSIFPILNWIAHYPFELNWIYSDFVAGLTVAIVLVPQGMSYAQLATLSPEYGLYSSFVGLMIYAFFATSKDVSIGPVAVMSMELGKIIGRVEARSNNAYLPHEIGTTLALLCGAITLGIGLLRLGFIVELIPLPAVLAFMGGSAFNIMLGQIPGLMGFSKYVNTRDASYKIAINTLKNLHRTKVDAAFGLVSVFILYFWRWGAAQLYKKYPKNRAFFYLQHIRAAVVIIFATVISWAIIKDYPPGKTPAYKIIGKIQSGLGDVKLFHPPPGLAKDLAPDLPVATIVLVLEHISIAKSFGRINDYKINPNQEFIAIGVTNLIGTFFNAYPATGSFSRTALKSKCGVRTPFAGIFGGSCVLLAIYCFTSAFYYIPQAALSAIIIHAVSDLIPSWRVTWNLFKVNPLDCGIFIVGIFITVFAAIEDGIYFAVSAAAAVILWRLCITNGTFLGRVKIAETVNPIVHHKGDASNRNASSTQVIYNYKWVPLPQFPGNPSKVHTRYINSRVDVRLPPPGVLVYRLSESFVYPNSSRQSDAILDEIKRSYRDSRINRQITWNHPGPLIVRNPFKEAAKAIKRTRANFRRKGDNDVEEGAEQVEISRFNPDDHRPELKIVHLDFSQVVSIDTTSVQALIDLKKAIQLHCGPEFEIHFSGIINPWVIRGLVNAGFGGQDEADAGKLAKNATLESNEDEDGSPDTDDPLSVNIDTENVAQGDSSENRYLDVGVNNGRLRALYDSRHPHFHFDIPSYSEFDA